MTLREQLSDLEHKQWAHWTDYLLNLSTTEFSENIERWHRQINTDYKDLSEKEKDSDRSWADKVLELTKVSIGELIEKEIIHFEKPETEVNKAMVFYLRDLLRKLDTLCSPLTTGEKE